MEFKKVIDRYTTLSIFEKLPFQPKRIYYMQGMELGEIRGQHSHKKNKQVIICIQGDCYIQVNGVGCKVEENDYIILEPSDWHEMFDFSPDCILLVLASEEYDKDDYIR